MKNFKKAMTLIEVVVALLIITSWIIGTYYMYNRSQRLSKATWNKLTAIAIAREWIEAMQNIRDSNWISWPETPNCWDVANYHINCNGDDREDNPSSYKKIWKLNSSAAPVSYIIHQFTGSTATNLADTSNARWYLEEPTISSSIQSNSTL